MTSSHRSPRRPAPTRRPRSGLVMFVVGMVALAGAATGLLVAGAADDSATTGQGTRLIAASGKAASEHRKGAGSSEPVVETDDPAPTTTATTTEPDLRTPAAWPLHGAAARARRVPILMYHLIAAAPEGAAYPKLWVPPAELQKHVTALEQAGFTGVTLGEVWDAWHGDGRLPHRPVVLSFDDGDLTQVMGAGPILKAAGWPGVLNLATNHLGKGGMPMWGARRLIAQGWAVDSHTVTHPDLTSLSPEALRRELEGSRAAIKAKLGMTPRFFCYPAGRNDDASRAAVRAAGYKAATTVEPGLASVKDDAFALPRVRVDPGTSGSGIVALAKGTATPEGGSGE